MQSNEKGVLSSCRMEKEALLRSFEQLKHLCCKATTLVTDRHPQISKHMRLMMPEVEHFFDNWHIAKGLNYIREIIAMWLDY